MIFPTYILEKQTQFLTSLNCFKYNAFNNIHHKKYILSHYKIKIYHLNEEEERLKALDFENSAYLQEPK